MAEYIEREEALNRLCQENCGHDFVEDKCHNCYTSSFITYFPAADVAPVVHGKWRHLGGDEWCCTNCGEVLHTEGSWEKPDKKFCYECGARMDGE